MALAINKKQEDDTVPTFEVTERLYKTADGEVVTDGHPDAAFLYATPGDEIPVEEAREHGLARAPTKQAEKPADKQRPPARNKAKRAE